MKILLKAEKGACANYSRFLLHVSITAIKYSNGS